MGKKRDDEEEQTEGYEFIPPDFDEDAFIHKEIIGFKTTVTLFLVGIAAALASWGAFAALEGAKVAWLVGMLIFAVSFGALRPLYRVLHIDISHYKRREWLGSAFLLFFTWIAFWLIFINPPLSDFATPDVAGYASPGVVPTGGEVTIDLFYKDNDHVATRAFTLTHNGTVVATADDLRHVTGPHYRYTATDLAAGTYTYTVAGTDDKGLTGEANGTFEVRDEVLEVTVDDLTTPTGTVFVRVPLDEDEVYAAYLDLEGSDDHVYLEYDEALGGWKATRNFDGWQAGNNTFTVVVEQPNQFEGQLLIRGGVIKDPATYTVEVDEPGDYAGGVPSKPNPTKAPSREVPGPEVGLVAVGVLAVALVVRRRRD